MPERVCVCVRSVAVNFLIRHFFSSAANGKQLENQL